MIGWTISHYPDANRRDATKWRKILEKSAKPEAHWKLRMTCD